MAEYLENEKQVLDVLGIDSFRNISKEKICQFVSLIPNMDKEVAMAIVNQFPAYKEMSVALVDSLMDLYEKSLQSSNDTSTL